MKKKGFLSIWLAAIWCIFFLIVVGGATYAWFTFDPYTRVEPMSSTVGSGEITLLIAADPEDEFLEECVLPQSTSTGLKPVSTTDLEHFYRAYGQDRQGVSLTYADISKDAGENMIHGVLYLKSLSANCNVYLFQPGMDFGQDAQTLAALRLGLRFSTKEGVKTYIFALNGMGDTEGAAKRYTTPQSGVVVGGINGDSTAVYAEDPARELNSFLAIPNEERPQFPKAGTQELCTLQDQEVASVEYWLYLEGCDENCINEVQNREIALQLSFAGVTNANE